MQMNPYLGFRGQCEVAFRFYEQCLGGKIGAIFRYAGTPLADQMPADWQDKVMHGSVTVGEQTLEGCDGLSNDAAAACWLPLFGAK